MRTLNAMWAADALFDRVFEVLNGLLKIDLVRELPETMKPRKIAIGAPGNDAPQIEHKQAA